MVFTLNNGNNIPALGLGTFKIDPKDAQIAVREGLKMGYRLIDTANYYVNERAVGRGIKESGVDRKEIFISSKLWPTEYTNPNAIDETLNRIGIDYIDLLFLHQPCGEYLQGYKMIEKAYKEGKVKNIGLSNFEGDYFIDIINKISIIPQVMQVEAHPYFPQDELRVNLDKYGIKLMSWFPLGHGNTEMLSEPILKELANKYNKTVVQIILRWHTQMGFIVIPGSKNVEHIKENFNIFDFELTKDDMEKISKLKEKGRLYIRTQEKFQKYLTLYPEYEKNN